MENVLKYVNLQQKEKKNLLNIYQQDHFEAYQSTTQEHQTKN